NVLQADTSSHATSQGKVQQICSLRGNLLLCLGLAQLLSLLHDLGLDQLRLIEQPGRVRPRRSRLLSRLQGLLQAGQTSIRAKAGVGAEVAEPTALLFSNKHDAVRIAVEPYPTEHLGVTTCLTLVPEPSLAALVHAGPCSQRFRNT